jgi:uncharacterized protein
MCGRFPGSRRPLRADPTRRTRVRRLPKRGVYDRDTIYRILDEALIGHVGFVSEQLPYVIPMVVVSKQGRFAFVRIHSQLLDAPSRHRSRGLRVRQPRGRDRGVPVHLRQLNDHRSVVVFGRATPITTPGEERQALRTIVEHVLPGRWREARPSKKELRATTILTLPLSESSAKVRSRPPAGDEADLELGVWAGEIPLRMTPLPLVPDPLLDSEVAVPESVKRFVSHFAWR